MSDVSVTPLTGQALTKALPALAQLRTEVFRAWPYLYEGDAAYEEAYLRRYAESDGALIVGASDGATLVGAATAAPMEDHAAAFRDAFEAHGLDPREILYCGESVLRTSYRGQGLGHAFFDAREAHGRALGRRRICFCGVVRDPDDPRRPKHYRPLDGFWSKRGYARVEGLTATYDWREVGAAEESAHVMQFWMRDL